MYLRTIYSRFSEPFLVAGRPQPALLALFFLINLIVLVNALLHPSSVGYDAKDHLKYIQALAQGHLVDFDESHEFFSPPLPYLFPAILSHVFPPQFNRFAQAAQLLNVLLSLGLTFFLLKLCDLINPGQLPLKFSALGFLGILPVYYKTFAFIRGEPFVAFFTMLVAYYALLILVKGNRSVQSAILLGLALGLAGLSRQWGLLLVPALLAALGLGLLRNIRDYKRLIVLLVISLATGFAICSWFYLSLYFRYGSITAFNRTPGSSLELTNQPASFYFGLGSDQLFTHPFRSSFANEFLPIFYSEIWGDYWGYFDIYGKDTLSGEWVSGIELASALAQPQLPAGFVTNRNTMAPYLGSVNFVGLFPSLLGLIACLTVTPDLVYLVTHPRTLDFQREARSLLLLLVVFSLMGYFWFLISYPSPNKGDTIKATYMLQIFPLIAIFVGMLMNTLFQRTPRLYYVIIGCLGVIGLYNFPVLITHYFNF